MNKRVFVINGSGGVGKDTFIELVNNYASLGNYSSVELVKAYAKRLGWDGVKDEKGRRFLSDIKDALTKYNDAPFKFMQGCVKSFYENEALDFCFLHIREPEEIQRAKEEFNAKTILVTRDSVEHISSNHADARVKEYDYDIHIDNNGTLKQLEATARDFVKVYK